MCRRPLLPLLALAVLMVNLPSSHGTVTSCYQCSEPKQALRSASAASPRGGFVWSSEPACSKFDSSNSTFKKDCPTGVDKSCFTTYDTDGSVASRGCYNLVRNNCTVDETGVKTCCCLSDYCNSAGLTTPALLLLPAALMAAIYSRQ